MGVLATDVAVFLGKPLLGDNLEIQHISSLDRVLPKSLLFAKKYSESITNTLNSSEDCLALVTFDFKEKLRVSHILCENPRLSFSHVLTKFFDNQESTGIHETAIVSDTAELGTAVNIGRHSVIGGDVSIGAYTTILDNVVIDNGCSVGEHCYVKSNTVIGNKGFAFEIDDEGRPTKLPQLGRVFIGNHVEIGALNTIARGSIDNTTIEDYVKTDDHVHIAHNVILGQNSIVTACAEISGSVRIGSGCWLGPNCSVMNKVEIGSNATVGIGAVVTRSVQAGTTVIGNPARKLPR